MTILSQGDIAVVGFQPDTLDAFSVVFLTDVDTAHSISFTEMSWTNGNSFFLGEGNITWTPPASITAGSVVSFLVADGAALFNVFINGVAAGSVQASRPDGSGNFWSMSNGGDQLFVYQGTPQNPDLIWGIDADDSDSSGAWVPQPAGTGGSNSTRPVSSDLNLAFSPAYIDLNGTGNGEQLQYVGSRSGTKAELQAAIANTSNWTAQDAPIGTSATSDFFTSTAFSVTAMGAPPTLIINGGSTVLEGGVDTIISGELMTTDPDTSASDLTYTVTTLAPANGSLWVDSDGSGTINNAESALAVNGTFTQQDILNGQLKYAHNSGETTSDSFGFKVADPSTEITGQTFNFTVTPQNDDPVISNLDANMVPYFEGFTTAFLDASFDAFVTDVDSTDFNGGTLTVSFASGATTDDQLGFNSVGNGPNQALLVGGTLVFVEGVDVGIVTSDGTAGTPFTVNLNSANATPARISVLLKSLTYQNNAGDNPIGSTRDVNVQLTDGDGGSHTVAVSLSIFPLNDNPTVTNAPTSISVVENTASPVDLSSVVVADPDSASVTVILTVTDGTFNAPADGSGVGSGVTETLVTSKTIELSGAPADINTYLDTASNIQYVGAVADVGTGADTITVTVNDGDGSGDLPLGSVSVDITASNAAPTVSGTPTDVTVLEDTQSNLDLSGITLADTDGDTLTLTLNISLGSFAQPADGAGVGVTEALDSSTQLRLIGTAAAINTYLDTASNIQYTGPLNANGQDQAVISGNVSDGTAAAVSLPNINIDITPDNDAPIATGVPTDIVVTEDTASNVDLSAVTFSDVEGDALTVSLIAGNGAFSGTTGGGVVVGGSGTATLTLAGSVADINTYLDTASNIQYTGAFNLSGPDADTVNIRADDSTDDVLVGTFDIDITNTNDAPTLSGPLPVSISAVEDTPSNVDLSGVTFEDADGDTLTVTLAATAGVFTALNAGGVVVGNSGSASMTLTGSAADINTYLDTVSSVQYTGATDAFGPNAATFTINVSDTTVNPQFGPINISLSPVDDPAIAQDDGFLSTTDTKTVGNVFAANIGSVDVDVDSPLVVTDINGQAADLGDFITLGSGARVRLNSNGNFTYDPNGQFSNVTVGNVGQDMFTYGLNGQDTATVVVFMSGVTDQVEVGTLLADVYQGGGGNDFLSGQAGDDTINGGVGNDTLDGGADNDLLNGGAGNDSIIGGDGDDDLLGADGVDTIDGGSGADLINGGAGRDLLLGGSGDDTVNGGSGGDTLNGASGNDELSGMEGADTITGGVGDDTLKGGSGDDTLAGGADNDLLLGGSGEDLLNGAGGNDTLEGSTGNDTLNGGAGDDELHGGIGADLMTGGTGNDLMTGIDDVVVDTFRFQDGFGSDTVTGFENGFDLIDLVGVAAITDFADLVANHLTEVGGTAQIVDGANTISLTGFTQSQVGVGLDIDSTDFIF